MRQITKVLALIAGLFPAIAAAQPATLPANTFYGRLAVPSNGGPGQAIPFAKFPFIIGSVPIVGGAAGQLLFDNNGIMGEYSASAARTYLGLASVYSAACSTHQWISAIASGVPGCTQPSFADLTSNIAVSQMNGGTNASASTMWRGDGTWVAPQAMPYTPTNTSPAVQTIQAQLQKIPVSCEDYSGGCTATNIAQAMTDAASSQRCFQFNGTYTVTTTVSLVGITSNLCLTGRGGLRGPSSGTFTAVLEIKNFTGITVDGNISIDCAANAYIGAGLKIWSSGASAQFQNINFSEYANCRQAIQIGDPSQSTLPISEITISSGFMFNVAQGLRVWSSQAVVNVKGMINIVDPHSSGNWALTATGTCSGATITLSSVGANSYFDQYDALVGTGIAAGTYITGQASGTGGGAGAYNLSQSCSSSGAAITGEKRGINYWASGGNVSVTGGEAINAVVSNGFLCVIDIMASPNQYGFCSFNGGVIEDAGALAASFNPTGIGSPVGGSISFTGSVQGSTSNITLDAISTDASFPGTVTVMNARFTATSSRSNKNITAANSATKVYADAGSFSTNYLAGTAGFSGGTQTFPIVKIKRTAFTSTGTSTYTRDPAAYQIFGECVGSGGAGGGIAGVASTFLSAGGGGSGGYSNALLTAAQVGASQTVTIPAGGTAATAGNNAGGSGGLASIGALVVANGGTGGQPTSGTGTVGPGGPGATISGAVGDETVPGGDGGGGAGFLSANGQAFYTGSGGASRWSGTANATSGASTGALGKLYGGGSAGATAITTGNTASLAGAQGKCQVTEYLMQ